MVSERALEKAVLYQPHEGCSWPFVLNLAHKRAFVLLISPAKELKLSKDMLESDFAHSKEDTGHARPSLG